MSHATATASAFGADLDAPNREVLIRHPAAQHVGPCGSRCGGLPVVEARRLAHALSCPQCAMEAGYADTLARRDTPGLRRMTAEAFEGWARGRNAALSLVVFGSGSAA